MEISTLTLIFFFATSFEASLAPSSAWRSPSTRSEDVYSEKLSGGALDFTLAWACGLAFLLPAPKPTRLPPAHRDRRREERERERTEPSQASNARGAREETQRERERAPLAAGAPRRSAATRPSVPSRNTFPSSLEDWGASRHCAALSTATTSPHEQRQRPLVTLPPPGVCPRRA